MRRRRGRATLAAVAAALLLTAVLAPAAPASADDPTWAEVQAAKKDVRKKSAAVAAIEQALGGLEDKAAQLGEIAVQRAATAQAAEDRLSTAERALAGLQAQTDAARLRAATARRTAGAVAAQLSRNGDPSLSLWVSGRRSGSLLYRLGALQQIGDASASLLETARDEERQAAALGAQARVAAKERDALAKAATAASNLAKQAQQQADSQVAETRKRTARLQAQLAALQATSDALSASYAAAQAAKRAAAAAGDGGGGGGSLSSIAAGPDSLSPGGAQSYAASRLGAFGWDGGQMGCLTRLWNIESGWRWNAYNASSGAYGIPQSLPGSKMAASGGDWTTSSKTQIEWGLGYIRARYSTPCGALAFETSHTPYWY